MFGSKLPEGYWLQQKTPEKGWRVQWLKCWEYTNQDKDNSWNNVNNRILLLLLLLLYKSGKDR